MVELGPRLGLRPLYAAAHVIHLWTWALENAPDGDLSQLTARQIAAGAAWDGPPRKLVSALLAVGLFDPGPRIHDWDEYGGKAATRREENAERMHRTRCKNVHCTRCARGRLDKTREEKSREDENTTPLPPPHAEGERPKRRRRSEPVSEQVVPLSDDDERWPRALELLSERVVPSLFSGVLQKLEPVGRAEDGGLLLRVAPSMATEALALVGTIARALEEVGDDAGHRAAIVQ